MTNTTPAYNLKVVLKETGLAADTLRAWERRYGLPSPGRSAGGHRLYSQRDIDTIKWLMARQVDGLSISKAVDLWNEQTSAGIDLLADFVAPGFPSPIAATLEIYRNEWIKACMGFNEYLAERTLNEAFGLFPFETVCTDVLQRGLSELGDKWYRNEATVQQEHFASALALRKLDSLISAAPPPVYPQMVLMCGTPGEGHFFSILLLTLFMRRRGFPVIFLGANVPFLQLDNTLALIKPDLVVLSAQQLITAASLLEVVRGLDRFKTKIAFGGRIFNILPELRRRIPAYFLGVTIEDATKTMEVLLTSKTGLPPLESSSIRNTAIAEQFSHDRTMIDMETTKRVGSLGIPYNYLQTALVGLGDNIRSAVFLGYMDSLKPELDWIIGLMEYHKVDRAAFTPLTNAYALSVEKVMGQSGQEISDWLLKNAGV